MIDWVKMNSPPRHTKYHSFRELYLTKVFSSVLFCTDQANTTKLITVWNRHGPPPNECVPSLADGLLYVLFLSHTGSEINCKGKIDRKGSHGSTNRLCIDATYYSPLAVLGVSGLRKQTSYLLKSFHQQALLQTDG